MGTKEQQNLCFCKKITHEHPLCAYKCTIIVFLKLDLIVPFHATSIFRAIVILLFLFWLTVSKVPGRV